MLRNKLQKEVMAGNEVAMTVFSIPGLLFANVAAQSVAFWLSAQESLFPGVDIEPGWEPTEAPPTEPPKEWKVTSNYVNIRNGPAKDYDRVRQVHKGDLVYVQL